MRIILLVLAVGILTSCANDAEVQKLRVENDSLRNVLTESESAMSTVSGTYGEIESNLELVAYKKAKIEDLAQKSTLTEEDKQLILQELDSIHFLLETNKKRVDELKENVGEDEVVGLDLIISSMNEKNEAEDEGLTMVKQDLAQISEDFSQLFEEFVYTEAENLEMKEQLSSTHEELRAAQEKLESAKQRLYTGYYVIGSKDDLKAKGIVYTAGLFSSEDVNQDFDRSLFRKVNTMDFKEVILHGKRCKIITTHPSESYELQGIKKKTEKLLIKDPDKFWSVSKFLIIETE